MLVSTPQPDHVAASQSQPAAAAAVPMQCRATRAESLLALQRAAGNRAVGRMLLRTSFHPGVRHDHAPSGKWSEVQDEPNSGFWANRVCGNATANQVVGVAIWKEFDDKPLALEHLNWYLGMGQGADFVEDDHIARMLRTDTGVAGQILRRLPSRWPASGTQAGAFKVEQDHYVSQDFRYAFGAIDRLDFEVDWSARTIHVWFQDRYEWHPVYPGLYKKHGDDEVRETNCVHAALVELKSGGAADYWMKGEATIPLGDLAVPVKSKPDKGGGGL